MKKMQQALMRQDVHQSTPTNQSSQPQPSYQHEDSWKKTTMIDIACIGATPFQHHIHNRDTKVFLTSLHEIDQVIEKKQNNEQEQENAAEWEQIQQKLPAQYQRYVDVFSKRASDEMPSHQPNDYQIGLEEGHTSEQIIGYSPLYKQSVKGLTAAHDYIIDNLSKRFIGSSAASFASSILMAWKSGDGL